VQWAKEAAGTRAGTSGTNIGQAPLQWAFSAAAVVFVRDHPAGQQLLASWENKPRTGNALTIWTHQLARAVSDLFKHKTAVERYKFLNG
jgi:hypothetical protein